jgi:hypothetical protein
VVPWILTLLKGPAQTEAAVGEFETGAVDTGDAETGALVVGDTETGAGVGLLLGKADGDFKGLEDGEWDGHEVGVFVGERVVGLVEGESVKHCEIFIVMVLPEQVSPNCIDDLRLFPS